MAIIRNFTRPHEDEIRQLRIDLWMARETIISLMPEPIQRILKSYLQCVSRQESAAWKYSVIEQIIGLVQDIPPPHNFNWGQSSRGNCPLCKEGPRTNYTYEKGFAIPEGLRRHLTGSGANECCVMKAASSLAWDHFDSKFKGKVD